MITKNFGEIKAIAFDIDGTLYETWKLNIRIPLRFLAHIYFFSVYGLVRVKLRKMNITENFSQLQNQYMAKALFMSEEKAAKKMDRIVYSGLNPYFKKFSACKNAVETVKAFKEAGFKIALLSDFPPEQKGELWGMKPYCDVMLGTESCGALKPSPVPFKKMAQELGIAPEEILYVGNSFKYDVLGAKAAGMKAVWFSKKKDKTKTADFVFKDYEDLKRVVLE